MAPGENFDRNQGSSTVAAWDVSVFNTGSVLQEGRVFTDKLFLNMGANHALVRVLNSIVYVLTEDGYQYKVDFNGMDPFGFLFFSNSRGMLLDTGSGYQSLYHSVKSNNNALSDLAAHDILLNANPTEDVDKTHRIFFNEPDSYVRQQYTGSPNLSDGSLVVQDNLTFTPAYDPANTGDGTVVGFGGAFSLDNSLGTLSGTTFQVSLDLDGVNGQASNKVVLSNALVKGVNKVVWDGRDQYGNIVPAGTYANALTVQVKGGEVHFPLLDVENNQFGFKVEMMNNIASGPDKSTIYYNNKSNQPSYSGGWSSSNWTVADGLDESDGVISSGGAMKYAGNAGDMTALDVWTYHSNEASSDLDFEIYNLTREFRVTKIWDNAGDPSGGLKPTDNTFITVQLQWRVAGSGAAWANYTGVNDGNAGTEDYHSTVTFRSGDGRTFQNLEFYAGGQDPSNPLCYEYRVVETAPTYNNYLVSSTFGDVDGFGVAGSQEITNLFEPERGQITIHKLWEDDAAASGVRPAKIRVQAFYRVEYSGADWEEFLNPSEGIIELSQDTGWTGILQPFRENIAI